MLRDVVQKYAVRGACTCARCLDGPPNPQEHQPQGHTADVFFFKVGLADPDCDRAAMAEELRAALTAEYPDQERLRGGPSYIEMGAALGDQGYALTLMGLGELAGLWTVIRPDTLGFQGEKAQQMAGNGMVMISGLRPAEERVSA